MRSVSMDGYVAVVSPYLSASIVGQEALTRIRTVAAKLPPCSLAGLELRLQGDQPNVDFFVRLPYVTPGLAPSLLAHPVWAAVQRLCDAMASPSSPLHAQVRRLFLEFDLDVPPPAVPVPGLFLELHTHRPFSARDLISMAGSVVYDQHRSRVSEDVLNRCVSALPAGARVAHLGLMPARPGKAMRLVIHGVPTSGVAAYLDSIGWRDPTRQLPPLLADVAGLADEVAMVDVDVDEAVRPRIGVEFYVRREIDNLPRWSAMFAFLVERGLASQGKTAALLAWPGFTQESPSNSAWAENLALGDTLFRGVARSVFWRNINHIKLSFEPGQEPEVKIYLGFGHNWFPTGAAAGAE